MRTVWVDATDVDGRLHEGAVVTAARALSDWCLRGDDGGEPIPAGATLEVLEVRGWGRAMVQECVSLNADTSERDAIAAAMVELEAEGLWELAR